MDFSANSPVSAFPGWKANHASHEVCRRCAAATSRRRPAAPKQPPTPGILCSSLVTATCNVICHRAFYRIHGTGRKSARLTGSKPKPQTETKDTDRAQTGVIFLPLFSLLVPFPLVYDDAACKSRPPTNEKKPVFGLTSCRLLRHITLPQSQLRVTAMP